MKKPTGNWKCRACGEVWDGSQLYDDPSSTAIMWTCANLQCGGTCDPVQADRYTEASEYIKRTVPGSDVAGTMS